MLEGWGRKTESNRLEEKIPSHHLKKKNLVLCKSGDSVFHFLYNPLGTRKSIIRDQTEGPLDSNPKTQFIFLFSVAEDGKEGMSC